MCPAINSVRPGRTTVTINVARARETLMRRARGENALTRESGSCRSRRALSLFSTLRLSSRATESHKEDDTLAPTRLHARRVLERRSVLGRLAAFRRRSRCSCFTCDSVASADASQESVSDDSLVHIQARPHLQPLLTGSESPCSALVPCSPRAVVALQGSVGSSLSANRSASSRHASDMLAK